MAEFAYTPLFGGGPDPTDYEVLTRDHVSIGEYRGGPVLDVAPEGLTLLAERAFHDAAFFLRPSHLRQMAAILEDPESSASDRAVALEMLRNAVVSADGVFPMCQDTGTAIIIAEKGQRVFTGGGDAEALSRGVFQAYARNCFRYAQNAPLTMYEERNTGTNLPAQVEISAVDGGEYDFLFIAKGGGSANKTYLFQETKAVLDPAVLERFLVGKMKGIGTAACPPYHLAVVVGGMSAELVLRTVKLAAARALDHLPTRGGPGGHAFRDLELEAALLEASRRIGLGAGFGGKHFCLDVRVIRLPRHGASCPIGIGVGCNADRNVKAKITPRGILLERLERDPSRYLPSPVPGAAPAVRIDLDRPMSEIRAALGRHPVGTRLSLSGPLITARDLVHARLKAALDRGEGLPGYFKDHVIFYAGPAKTPPGHPAGSMGPTTAARMDDYIAPFQKAGGSLVTLAKGNRSRSVTESCRDHGGFYLGTIGGPAARLARDCITGLEVVAFPELGMEAVFRVTVRDFPAFLVVDDKGNDLFERLLA